jgi:hypothetical protein
MAIKTNGSGEKRVATFAVENSDRLWKAVWAYCRGMDAIAFGSEICEIVASLEGYRSGSPRKVENSVLSSKVGGARRNYGIEF